MAVTTAEIKLTNANDGYSLSVSPESVTISANTDGSNAELSNALTFIRMYRGDKKMNIAVYDVTAITGSTDETSDIDSVTDYTLTACDEDGNEDDSVIETGDDGMEYAPCWMLKLEAISEELTSGGVVFNVKSEDEYVIEARYTYTVIRESTMLDWILDWDSNATTIGGDYIITPKIFVGEKISEDNESATTLLELDSLNGVYIGSSDLIYGSDASDGMSGVYGIYGSEIIFRIDGNGGYIAGWTIETNSIWSAHIELFQDTLTKYVAVSKSAVTEKGVMMDSIAENGGVEMFYNFVDNVLEYGFAAFKDDVQTFAAGSDNFIGPWQFDEDALWYGSKSNVAESTMESKGDITIGTEGIRGYGWYIDSDGDCSFANGYVTFSSSGGTIAGWEIRSTGLRDDHAIIFASDTESGFAFSATNDISTNSFRTAMSAIQSGGGVYLECSENDSLTEFAGYDNDGGLLFRLSSTEASKVGGWYFTDAAIYISDDGEVPTTNESTGLVGEGELILTADGLLGSSWGLLSDGTGILADGNVYWDEDGVFHMTVCELSGFIRIEPRVIKDIEDDFDDISGDDDDDESARSRYLNVDLSNLYKGGFVYLTIEDNSYMGDYIRLPMLLKYAGAQITICVKNGEKIFWVTCTDEHICEEDEEDYGTAPDGNSYKNWNYEGDEVYTKTDSGSYRWSDGSSLNGTAYPNRITDDNGNEVLVGIRCGGTAVNYVKFDSKHSNNTNKMLLLMAVPYHQDVYDEDDEQWYRGMVEWEILNPQLYEVDETDDGIPYAVYVG